MASAVDNPICIITSSGMKCLASPLKNHFPGRKQCVVAKKDLRLEAKLGRMAELLRHRELRLSKGEQTIIARVSELLPTAKVGDHTAFTIVSAGEGARRPRR